MGISESETFSKITVYPNPTDGKIHFSTRKNIKEVQLFDISGRFVKSLTLTENQIDLSGLPTGNYILKIFMEDGTLSSQKVIKK